MRKRFRWYWLLLLGLFPAGCVAENIISDPATRLAFQIRDQSRLLRWSGKATRTFMHQPSTFWPDHFTGDYRISFQQFPSRPAGDRGLAAEQVTGDGPTAAPLTTSTSSRWPGTWRSSTVSASPRSSPSSCATATSCSRT